MNMKKILAAFLAVAVCLAIPMTAIAATVRANDGISLLDAEEGSSGEGGSVEDASTEEASTEEAPTEEASTEEASTEEGSTEEASTEPTKSDVISLILKFLGTIKLDEVKDALNDINEALGLPRVETFADMAAYADALYEKLEAIGLGYNDIINAIQSSDLIEWLNGLLFGKNDAPTTAVVNGDSNDEEDPSADGSADSTPDTGIALATTGAAAATLLISSALAFVLKKRNSEAEEE